jgi:prepilin-type processing-associated H-X9-DG protein
VWILFEPSIFLQANPGPEFFAMDYDNAASSYPGGGNLLLADGSVRFASDAIQLQVWQALPTRAGGEAVADADH